MATNPTILCLPIKNCLKLSRKLYPKRGDLRGSLKSVNNSPMLTMALFMVQTVRNILWKTNLRSVVSISSLRFLTTTKNITNIKILLSTPLIKSPLKKLSKITRQDLWQKYLINTLFSMVTNLTRKCMLPIHRRKSIQRNRTWRSSLTSQP